MISGNWRRVFLYYAKAESQKLRRERSVDTANSWYSCSKAISREPTVFLQLGCSPGTLSFDSAVFFDSCEDTSFCSLLLGDINAFKTNEKRQERASYNYSNNSSHSIVLFNLNPRTPTLTDPYSRSHTHGPKPTDPPPADLLSSETKNHLNSNSSPTSEAINNFR